MISTLKLYRTVTLAASAAVLGLATMVGATAQAAELDRLKPGAGVVNIGRGPIVDYDALCARLDDGRL